VNRPQLLLQSRRLSASGTTYSWLNDPQPYRMPAAIWFGPCNSNPVTYPGRANDVHGTFVLDGKRLHQLGRAVDPDWWISFPVATPPAAVAGWTSFADFSWRPRTSRLTLQEIPQVVSGSELTPADPRSRPYAPVALLLVNDLLEPMAEAGLAYRDVVIDPGGGGGATGGGQRPTEGVLWPPPPPEWGGSSRQQD